LVIPHTERVAVNRYLATIIGCDHELDGLMFRNSDVAGHVNHEQVVGAVLE
jgi:hypothetical protein